MFACMYVCALCACPMATEVVGAADQIQNFFKSNKCALYCSAISPAQCWTSEIPASPFHLLRLQVCTIMFVMLWVCAWPIYWATFPAFEISFKAMSQSLTSCRIHPYLSFSKVVKESLESIQSQSQCSQTAPSAPWKERLEEPSLPEHLCSIHFSVGSIWVCYYVA